ncbi:MAG: DUF4342 domain-containing protein [Oscillospiraceae bacterium]|nr:DUF4342 domain-containing protein [Oscillospiraceae bacterium]
MDNNENNLELVEKLVAKTGVSYADAKRALESSDWNMLDAMIWLEEDGKLERGRTTAYSTGEKKKSAGAENFRKGAKSFGAWLRGVIDKGNTNCLEMYRNDERQLSVPVTVFVLLLCIGFWIVVPLMIVGLFLGCRFAFSGPDLGKDKVNKAMAKATDVADGIKSEIAKGEQNNQ